MTEQQTITILARRWFDRINGNTYHSVKVYVGNKEIGYCPFAYGYNDGFLQTAVDLMVKAGIMEEEPDKIDKHGTRIKGSSRAYLNFLDDIRIHPNKYLINVVDVVRKRDLAF